MISILQIEFLFLLLHRVYSEEPEPLFRVEGGVVELGYCFGMEYIVVYRSAPEDQLLGNSSSTVASFAPPADLQGRIHITNQQHLVGLQIHHLTHSDSGIYRRECWENQTLASHHTQQLSVCGAEKLTMVEKDEGGEVELLCNSTLIGQAGTTVRWYYETHPDYKVTLILDSSVSLNLLVEELQGVVEVKDRGALLQVPSSVFKHLPQFYCLTVKGDKCLSFQNFYLEDHSDVRNIFAAQGDTVVLNCPSDHKNQEWETPLGLINGTTTDGSMKINQMHLSGENESESYSLVISAVSDKHDGEYSCITPFFRVQYSLTLCPKKEPQRKVAFEGQDISLECDVGQDEFQTVQWYRRGTSGEDNLIQDSKDQSIAIPEDLRGRLILSEHGSSLTLSSLTAKDITVYWCIVLGGLEFLEGDDYNVSEEVEDTVLDDYYDDRYWSDSYRCIFKQETILNKKQEGRGLTFEPSDPKSTAKPEPPAASNVTAYAVGGGLVALLLVAVIAAVVVLKKRAKPSSNQRGSASGSGRNTNKEIELNVDAGCTERLTSSD